MESKGIAEEQTLINTGVLTVAGLVALLGALLLGVAALMGSNALMSAAREWINQQEVPPTQTAVSMIKQVHDAALAGTSAATDAWRSTLASSSDS